MSYKSQLFPLSSTGEKPLRLRIGHSWGSAPLKLEEMKVLRSWLIYHSEIGDSEVLQGFGRRRVNWTGLLGLALATFVSAGIWAGVGLMFARVWK